MLTRQDRHLRFEHLERRILLAGDVQVTVRSGSLIITGDAQGNSVEIWYMGNHRYNVDGASGTTVSTKSQHRVNTVTVEGVMKDILINLRDGNNEVLLAGTEDTDRFSVPRNLEIETGANHDGIMLDYGTVGRNLTIDAGSGDNVIGVNDVIAGRDLSVKTGKNYDVVSISQTIAEHNLSVKTGGADDEIALATITVAHDTTLDSGSPSPLQGSPSHLDRVLMTDANLGHSLHVTTGSGNDDVWIGNFEEVVNDIQTIFDESFALPDYSPVVTGSAVAVGHDLHIATSSGEDTVLLGEVSVTSLATIETGSDIDAIDMFNSNADQVKMLSGSGSESDVYFTGSQANSLYADMGSGDDLLIIDGSKVKNSLKLYGGTGHDAVFASGEFPLRRTLRGWEEIEGV